MQARVTVLEKKEAVTSITSPRDIDMGVVEQLQRAVAKAQIDMKRAVEVADEKTAVYDRLFSDYTSVLLVGKKRGRKAVGAGA